MLIQTQAGPFRKALATNSTDTSFPSRVPRLGIPLDGGGVVDLSNGADAGGANENLIVAVPYAVAGNDDTFSMRVIGWRGVGNGASQMGIPVILAEFACTCCAAVGVTGGAILATERFCDTITLVTGNDDVTAEIISPGGDVIAHVMFDVKGFTSVEFTFDSTAVGATSMNVLIAQI